MKKIFSTLAIASSLVYFASCDKDEGKLPNIAFKNTSGYVSANTTVKKDTVVLIGINASKSEDKDVLTNFTGTVSYNGGSDSTLVTESLSGSSGDSYSKDIVVHTHNAAGSEKYTFTVINKDGLKNTVSLTLTVQ
jgi:hypothetical protein